MSFLFFGLGAGNKVMNLNMVVLLDLRAERVRLTACEVHSCPVPPSFLLVLILDLLKQRLQSADK